MREVEIKGIGTVTMYKRRRMKNIRIAVLADGRVRVTLPKWSSYLSAQRFAARQSAWIKKQKLKRSNPTIAPGDRIGKLATIHFERTASQRTISSVSTSKVILRTPHAFDSEHVQQKAKAASEKSLKLQAERILPPRVAQIARENGFKYADLKVKRLTSRWGSCSAKGNIALSYFLMQLPDELINYVIVHELVHTEQHNHGRDFWQRLEEIVPDAKQVRKVIRPHQPVLQPYQ